MFLKHNIVAIVWAAFIMILCGLPGNDFPDLTFIEWLQPDKIMHLFMFGMLSYLLIRGFGKQISFAPLNHSPKLYATLFTIFYGILTEVLQATVFTGRTGDLRDAAADALGAFCGIWFFNFLKNRKAATS